MSTILAAAALAALVSQAPVDAVYTDDDGCRWLSKSAPAVPAVKPKPRPKPRAAAAPASAPSSPAVVKPRPKPPRKLTAAKPREAPPDFDLIGCDEGGLPPLTVLPPVEPPADFTPIPDVPFDEPPAEPGLPPAVPPSFCECEEPEPPWYGPPGGGYFGGGYGGFGGGGFVRPAPDLGVAQPVPEPETWALFALGLLGLAGIERRRRVSGS